MWLFTDLDDSQHTLLFKTVESWQDYVNKNQVTNFSIRFIPVAEK